MGPALHGEWVGCHAGLVKHRGARGSAPGWVDFAREATCIPSRARVRRTSAAAPAAARSCRRRGQWASPPSAQQAQEHAVLRYDARQMHDMLVVGAERLQSAAQAKLQVNAYRDRLRRMKREANAATLVQAVWRAGKARVAVDEMRWGAMIVQANFRARRDRTVFAQARRAAFQIQKHARGRVCRVHYHKIRKAAIIVQAVSRGRWARRDLKNRALRNIQLAEMVVDVKQFAARRVQAVFRGLQGRKIARAEQLRKMGADQRLSEIERARRAQDNDAMLKRQAVEWQEQQEEEAARLRRVEQDRKQREIDAARALVGDTGAIVRVTTRGAPGYGTFVAAFGLSKNTDWIQESSGDRAFR